MFAEKFIVQPSEQKGISNIHKYIGTTIVETLIVENDLLDLVISSLEKEGCKRFYEEFGHRICPYMQDTNITLFKRCDDVRTFNVGLSKTHDSNITFTNFKPCLGSRCMMYDTTTGTCRRSQ